MRLTQYHAPILKEDPSDATVLSHKLMLKAGLIRQMSHGLYTIMPMGVKVMHKISNIIRSELNKIGGMEVIFPTMQMNDAWIKSGRSEGYCGPETLRVKDRHGKDMLYSPTAEESAALIFGMDVKSYKSLPVNMYQINWKFRDEIRPRFGLMRCREFLMMDAYSFDINEESARVTYDNYFKAYLKIFQKIGLLAIPMQAESGEIGGDLSHEFHIIAETGESGIFYDKRLNDIMENIESANLDDIKNIYAKTEDKHDASNCNIPSDSLVQKRGIEVGHIFNFGDKYTKPMNIKIQDSNGQMIYPNCGSYGIGVTRLIAAFIEANNTGNGIKWNKQISPFDILLINTKPRDEEVTKKANEEYERLKSQGFDVLFDDTKDSNGAKFTRSEILGIPEVIKFGWN
jgi:prolyl-tRNA synthetase